MISLKSTLEAIKEKLSGHDASIKTLTENVVDQTAGNSVTLWAEGVCCGFGSYGVYVGLSFPFVTKNTNYTLTLKYVGIPNTGVTYSPKYSISRKCLNSVMLEVTNWNFSGAKYASVQYTITFA